MRPLNVCALALTMLASTGLWAQAAAPAPVAGDTVVLRSGDFTLTKAEYEALITGFTRDAGAVTTGPSPQSKQTGQEAARLLAFVSEAQRRKIDQTPQMQALMRVRSYVLLAGALQQALTAEARQDEAGTRALWNSEKNNYVDIVARQILIRYDGASTDKPNAAGSKRNEAQAKALATQLYAKLKAGGDFTALAKTSSDDEATKQQGGQLPAFTRGAMVSEFESAAFATPVGSISEPFKTKYGYHIIQVIERRPFAFERVRPTLEFMRARQKMEEIASKGVQLNEAYFSR